MLTPSSHSIRSCILTLAIFLLLSQPIYAIPARPTAMKVIGPEGTEISVTQHGDENFSFYKTEDGTLLKRVGNHFFYAEFDINGSLKKVNKATKISEKLPIKHRPRKISGLIQGSTFPIKDSPKVLVILVEYQDVKFNLENPLDYFSRMLNEEGFSDYRATGSAKDFFTYSSNGQFTPQFDVYGPITLQHKQEYYGGNDAFGQDLAPQRMAIEACRQINPDVDFSQYDCNKDQYIDNVFIFYAGQGEASGGSSNCVWPHAWNVESAEAGSTFIFDNVRLNRYACSNEWELSSLGYGYRPVGIGTFVHEFSHVMGLPDLYSTQYIEKTFTPGAWSVMDYGPYNNDGCTPPQYSIFERSALGYMSPPELKGVGNIALNTVDMGDGYIVPTENPAEYFLIENRQQKEWDAYIPGHGMLVWHIDYNKEIWATNAVNNDPLHNYVDIIEADGIPDEKSRGGDCFPGDAGITTLSGSTSPAWVDWNGQSPDLTLADITEKNGKILIRLNGGASDITPTTALSPQKILAGGFTAQWLPVEGAKGYTLSVYAKAENSSDETSRSIEYVPGYENLFVGNVSTFEIERLTPSSTYYYTVTVEDGLYGSCPSNEIRVTTLDPTLDYFSPVAIEAESITDRSFIAAWEPMEDANGYFIDVYTQLPGKPILDVVDFSDGTANFPKGWTSTTGNTYGMSSYSGEAPPSLRLSKNGDAIVSPLYDKDIVSLEFWIRGNQTGDDENLTIRALIEGKWENISTHHIVTQTGGATIQEDFSTRPGIRQIEIAFKKLEKGSVAIDDIRLQWGIPMIDTPIEEYTKKPVGNVSKYPINNLQPGTTYFYKLIATDGDLISLPSNTVAVTTLEKQSGISTIDSNPLSISIIGRVLTTSVPVSVYDISGQTIAIGKQQIQLPVAGIYIVRATGQPPLKIIAL